MKTQLFTPKQFKSFGFLLTLFALFTINLSFGQDTEAEINTVTSELLINGLVSDANGPLESVNVIQKGTRNGTVTNAKGEFKFPVKLKAGDILVFSYLGYQTKEFEITANTTFVKVVLDAESIEMIGALDSNKPYKSKRKKN